MHIPHMLIDRGCCLRAPVTFGVVELKCVHGEFTDGTLKSEAAV
jgi:hypothetical protein